MNKIIIPKIDGRNSESVLQEIKKISTYYTPDWNVGNENDSGVIITKAFAEMFSQIITRLNKLPEKNFIEFLNKLETKLKTSKVATAPVLFSLAQNVEKNIQIPKGTQISANDNDGEMIFETTKDYTITHAKITQLIEFSPENDGIYVYNDEYTKQKPFVLFGSDGEKNVQGHKLYIGHEQLFHLGSNTKIQIRFHLSGDQTEIQNFLGKNHAKIKNIFKNITIGFFGTDKEFSVKYNDIRPDPDNKFFTIDLSVKDLSHVPIQHVGGVNSRWLTLSFNTTNVENDIPEMRIRKIELKPYLEKKNSRMPDILINSKPPSSLEKFLPFGKAPVTYDSFYIGSEEIFSKTGTRAKIQLTYGKYKKDNHNWIHVYENADKIDTKLEKFSPKLSDASKLVWQYWNGGKWEPFLTTISHVKDKEGKPISNKEIIEFKIPTIVPYEINNSTNYWIRLQIKDGDYGRETYVSDPNIDNVYVVDNTSIVPPLVESLTLSYDGYRPNEESPDQFLPVNQIISYNNKSFIHHDLDSDFVPYEILNEDLSLYLGFDNKPSGIISIFFLMDLPTFDKMPIINFYYFDGLEWKKISIEDQTNNLTQSGYISLSIPDDFQKLDKFGQKLFWIKLVDSSKNVVSRKINFFHLNCLETKNSSPFEEIFSANGFPSQEISLGSSPLQDYPLEVWINEEHSIDGVADPNLKSLDPETWKKWQKVVSFYYSDPDDRHFVIDEVMKKLHFGNGINGKVPPLGTDNIQIKGITGGGKRGNLPTNSLTVLKRSVPFVDSITNVLPSDGGVDSESSQSAGLTVTSMLKNRGRAVTSEDFEQIARNNFPLSKVKCFPKKNNDGVPVGGSLKLIVVPQSSDAKPEPTAELLNAIKSLLSKKSISIISSQISVWKPNYEKISIRVKAYSESFEYTSTLKSLIEQKITDFLHPITGGFYGDGWNFGETFCFADLYSLIENISHVDYVDNIFVKIDTDDQNKSNLISKEITNDSELKIDSESLIFSGRHIITVETKA